MPIEKWSPDTVIVRLADDPLFSEELLALRTHLTGQSDKPADQIVRAVVLDFQAISYLNSANLSMLLLLRRHLVETDSQLVLCGISAPNWGTFLVTGLDRVFTFCDDVATSLASLKLRDPWGTRIEDSQ